MWWTSAAATPLEPSGRTEIAARWQPGSAVTVDTGATPPTMTDGTLVWDGVRDAGVAVFVFGEVALDVPVVVSGSSPFALLATGDLEVGASGSIDGAAWFGPGPGGGDGGRCGDGWGSGPGLGNNFNGSGGGHGGAGGSSGALAGGAAYGDPVALLQGGSGGGGSEMYEYAFCVAGTAGGGGGAIELGAGGRLVIDGTITVSGGAPSGYYGYGRAGGGSGGGLLLHANGGGGAGTLLATGGSTFAGGGGGGGRVTGIGVDPAGFGVDLAGGTSGGGGTDGTDGVATWEDPDADGDGATIVAGGDCDDRTAAVRPGLAEVAVDGIDQDCDGLDLCPVDGDGDGTAGTALAPGPLGCGVGEVDCDDADAAIHPGAVEVAADGIDQDCDGSELCPVDGDGDGASGEITAPDTTAPGPLGCGPGTDCDDADEDVFPGAAEVTCDGIDQDCAGGDDCETDTDTDTDTDADTDADSDADSDTDADADADSDTDTDTDTDTDGDPLPDRLPADPGPFAARGCATGRGSAPWAWLAALGLARRRSSR